MRLLEEQSRLEKRLEEAERKGEEIELRLEDELCSVRSRLAAKEEVVDLFQRMDSFIFAFLPLRSLPRPGSSWRRGRAGG